MRIIDWIEERWPDRPCPVCGQIDWNISGPGQFQTFDTSGYARRHFPVVPIACKNCANTVLFNARIMGISADDLAEWEDYINRVADEQTQAQ